jgi:phosphoribosylglycinamide formyltransferase-1
MSEKLKIGAFISGGGSNLQAIIDGCSQRKIDAQIVFTASDNPDAKGLERAARAGIPVFTVDYRQYKKSSEPQLPPDCNLDDIISRQSLFASGKSYDWLKSYFSSKISAEAAFLKKMSDYSFDLIVLAGFMRTLSPYFIDKVNTKGMLPKIMNIHPAILPSFPGTDGYADTYKYGCKVGGCTVHFVDYGEDSGPIIGQRTFDILPEDSLDQVKQKGLKLEWELFPYCIQLFAKNRLVLEQPEKGGRNIVKIRR